MDKLTPVFNRTFGLLKQIRNLEFVTLLRSFGYEDKANIYEYLTKQIPDIFGTDASNNCILVQNSSISKLIDFIAKSGKVCESKLLIKIANYRNDQKNLLLTALEISNTVEDSPRKCSRNYNETEFPKCVNNTIAINEDKLREIDTKVNDLWSNIQTDTVLAKECSEDLKTKLKNMTEPIVVDIRKCLNITDF